MPVHQKNRHGQIEIYGRVRFNGKTLSKKCKTEREAIVWEEQEKERLQQEANFKHVTDTACLLELMGDYIDDCIKSKHSKGSINAKKLAFRRMLKRFNPDSSPDQITKHELRNHILDVSSTISPHTANVDLVHIKAFGNWLVEFEKAQGLSWLKMRPVREPQAEKYVPPVEDFKKILSICSEEDALLLKTYLETHARKQEILKLEWKDVDLDRSQLRIWTGKRKGGKESNWIGISPALVEALTAQRQKTGLQGYVFINPKTGKPYGDRRKTLETLCRKAGVRRFTLHCLRHLGASLMAENGEALVNVQARLRHKNLTTTQRYLHQITAVEVPKVISSLSSELWERNEKSRLVK